MTFDYTRKPKVLILGSGGHGWEVLLDLILSGEYETTLSMLTVDNGGSTGTIRQVYQTQNIDVLPFGDLNKIVTVLSNYLSFQREESCDWNKVLNLRSCRIEDLADAFKLYFQVIIQPIYNDLDIYFYDFLKKYFQLVHSSGIANPAPPSLGNLLLTFLYLKGIEFNHFFKSIGIFPQDFNIFFTYPNCQTLHGQYFIWQSMYDLYEEKNLDVINHPLDPASIKLMNLDSSGKVQGLGDISDDFYRVLVEAKFVVIPTGSILNWMPLINISRVHSLLQDKSRQKSLFLLMNIFYAPNEYGFEVYLDYLHKIDLQPQILSTKHLDFNFKSPYFKQRQNLLGMYALEQKTLNLVNFERVFQLGWENLINLNLEMVDELSNPSKKFDQLISRGIKYSPISVASELNKLFKNHSSQSSKH